MLSCEPKRLSDVRGINGYLVSQTSLIPIVDKELGHFTWSFQVESLVDYLDGQHEMLDGIRAPDRFVELLDKVEDQHGI